MTNIAETETAATAGKSEPLLKSSLPARVWPAFVLIALFWAFYFAQQTMQLSQLGRFSALEGFRFFLLLYLVVWWLRSKNIPRRERFATIGLLLLAIAIFTALSHRAFNYVIFFFIVIPWLFLAWTIWTAIARSLPQTIQRAGLASLTLLILGGLCMMRWEGRDGVLRDTLSWRWSATAEDDFLATRLPATKSIQTPNQAPWTLQDGDWPEFRGPQRDGVVHNETIALDWTSNPPREIWRRRVGPGWGSMIVVDGRLVTQEQRGEFECVVCYNALTGDDEWEHREQSRFEEGVSGAGPRATPTFHNGKIVAQGAAGKVVCLNATDGSTLWSHDLVTETAASTPLWGFSASPLVIDDLAIVYSGAGQNRATLAYHMKDGTLAWSAGNTAISYSSPQSLTLHGEKQIVMHDQSQLVGLRVKDGAILWTRPGQSLTEYPMVQPKLLDDGRLLIGDEPGIVFVAVDRADSTWTSNTVKKTNRLRPSFNDFVIHDSHIYGLDDGILSCVDLATAERKWKRGRYGHGQVLLLAEQSRLLVLSETGDLVLLEATPAAHKELATFKAIEGKTWNHPVLAHGKLYVRNGEEMACFDLAAKE